MRIVHFRAFHAWGTFARHSRKYITIVDIFVAGKMLGGGFATRTCTGRSRDDATGHRHYHADSLMVWVTCLCMGHC
jgi:hypothetical protein